MKVDYLFLKGRSLEEVVESRRCLKLTFPCGSVKVMRGMHRTLNFKNVMLHLEDEIDEVDIV